METIYKNNGNFVLKSNDISGKNVFSRLCNYAFGMPFDFSVDFGESVNKQISFSVLLDYFSRNGVANPLTKTYDNIQTFAKHFNLPAGSKWEVSSKMIDNLFCTQA